MRKWYIYSFSDYKTTNDNLKNCFVELKISNNDLKLFRFTEFKKTVYWELYNFLIKKKLGRALSIGSGKAHLEYFLKLKGINIMASDINRDFISFNKRIRIENLDITSKNSHVIEKYGCFDTIYLPGIIYLFNNSQLNQMFKNIKRISKKNTKIFIFFRSRDSFVVRIIENIIIPIEILLKKVLLKKYRNKKIVKIFKGYRRSLNDFKKIILKNNFSILNIQSFNYDLEYKRSLIIKKLKLYKLLSLLFYKKHPYINIFELKIK